MSWFSNQIKSRTHRDDTVFQKSMVEIADSVMGTRMASFFEEGREDVDNAINDALRAMHRKPIAFPESITDSQEKIEYATRHYGILYRVVELTGDWYRHAGGVMLGMLREGGEEAEKDYCVAIVPGKLGGYEYVDRIDGKTVRIGKSNAGRLAREAILLYRPLPLRKLTLSDLWDYVWGEITPGEGIQFLLVSVLAVGVSLIIPVLNAIIVSDLLNKDHLEPFVSLVIFLVSVTISRILLSTAKNLITRRVGMKLDVSMGAAKMMRVFSLSPSFFKNYSAGDLAGRLDNMTRLTSSFVNAIFGTMLTAACSLAYIGQISMYSEHLVAPALFVIIATIAIFVITSILQIHQDEKILENSAKEQGMSYSMITGIQKIKLAGAEKRMFARWARLFAKGNTLLYNPPLFLKLNSALNLAVSLAGTLIIYSRAVRYGVTVPDFYAFNTSYGMLSGAFLSLAEVVMEFASLRPLIDMVRPILDAEPEVTEGRLSVTNLRGAVSLNHVSFRYQEDMPYVIDDLSLKVESGEYIAIVGRTGCGKSTLVRLLLGFEMPEKGAIYYDNLDLKSLELQSLRRKIGTVMQNGSLFSGSIYSNIVICAPWLTEEEAWESAEIAGIAEDIRRMPMGMHTYVPDGGIGFSGGQKQRIMIARAVAPKPSILILDEATSALDNITQRKISEALDALNCTRIVIAHRLSTIRQCSRILVLDGGKIVQDGTYEELVHQPGLFAELVERQKIGGEES